MNQNKKLLFFDVDGTLLAGGLPGYLPKSTMEALIKAQENGHYLFVNSGRTYSFLPQVIREFPFDGYLCGCGTEVIFHGETLYHNVIPMHLRRSLKSILHESGVQAVFEGHSSCFFDQEVDPFPPVTFLKDVYLDKTDPDVCRSFDDEELLFDKFGIYVGQNSDKALFLKKLHPYFQLIRLEHQGDYQFGEIVPAHCSKATGIDLLVKHLDCSIDDCFVFGDSANDLAMLQHVTHSIAMGNSVPEVLSIASYVTTPVDREGIPMALKHFRLI
ncbi:MAG: HAD family hydrolase [Eubacteriales bacterium]|nr:HAD family hydrolase [Eubacteriales bacterium]